jgi:hypothetical protein
MTEAEVIERLRVKVRVCDSALANLPSHLSEGGRTRLERAIRDVRADAVRELRTRGHDARGVAVD